MILSGSVPQPVWSVDVIHCSPSFRGDDRRLLKCQSELNACGLTLGELLKKKAESGVRVLIMIWGETTSIMGTHDTETENYFKGAHWFTGIQTTDMMR